jgi:hypothetical protein
MTASLQKRQFKAVGYGIGKLRRKIPGMAVAPPTNLLIETRSWREKTPNEYAISHWKTTAAVNIRHGRWVFSHSAKACTNRANFVKGMRKQDLPQQPDS